MMDTMQLPGGVLLDGQLRVDYRFKPITGKLERMIAESGTSATSLAEQVTDILSNALEMVAGVVVDKELVRSLSSGDRQYLLLRLRALLDPGPKWQTSNCQICAEPVQFQFDASGLPVKVANGSFPKTTVRLSIGSISLRAPNGADEEVLSSQLSSQDDAMKLLLNRLLIESGNPVNTDLLTEDDYLKVDRVLDEMSPQLSQSVKITCPYCSHQQEIPLDHYAWIIDESRFLDEEIHLLAFYYHWSEKQILSLPKSRRKHYIKLIERSLSRQVNANSRHDVEGERL